MIEGDTFTFTLYNNPPSNGAMASVLLVVIAQSFVLYDGEGGVFGSGTIPGGGQLVTGTLMLGQAYSPYPGMQAMVTMVGTVPGASACPTPAAGATVQYTFQGKTYQLSFVPGCGVTQYVDASTTITLKSIGSYPQLGTLERTRDLQPAHGVRHARRPRAHDRGRQRLRRVALRVVRTTSHSRYG